MDRAVAEYEMGMLTVTLPKVEGAVNEAPCGDAEERYQAEGGVGPLCHRGSGLYGESRGHSPS